jgi:16S rRNA (cytosine967-C5)-methyltransferase
LLDAPCSGLGVLRRNPDAKWKPLPDGPARFSRRQLDLMSRLAPRLRPGGVLVYAVCSFEPEENEQVVDAFLQTHPEFTLAAAPACGTVSFWEGILDSRGFLRTYPHRHDMDGFFAARLRRRSG